MDSDSEHRELVATSCLIGEMEKWRDMALGDRQLSEFESGERVESEVICTGKPCSNDETMT